MLLTILVNKLKSLILIIVNLFRKTLCCVSRRRSSCTDSVQLTHVISNSNDSPAEWTEWGQEHFEKEPKTVQDFINLYRKQAIKGSNSENQEEQLNFFEDMTPKITKQAKLLIGGKSNGSNGDKLDRLNFREDANILPSAELGEWEDSSGWEGENLGTEAQKVLREQKRVERERKAWELQQKRMEKSTNRSLGARVTT